MTAKYYAILTNQGAAKLANATALGTTLRLTQMAVGDANGVLSAPDATQTRLINQKRIAPLNSLSIDPDNSSQIIAEQVIPESEGGYWIRELGLYDDEGVLIAVANCPETYKPQMQEGSGRTQTVRMVLIVSSTAAVTLKIDPSVVLATRKYVDDKAIEVKAYADDQLKKHVAEANPHKQYLQINQNLKEIADAGSAAVANALKNLGLGEAKFIISRGRNANGAWTIWSDGAIELYGISGIHDNGKAQIIYPIALPSLSRYISIAERIKDDTSGNAVHLSLIIDSEVTANGFTARCQYANGSPSSNSFSWRVIYAPV